jgi:preprotein translocase subunit SecA
MYSHNNQQVSRDTTTSGAFSPFYILSWLKSLCGRLIGKPTEFELGEYWTAVKQIKATDVSNRSDSELAASIQQMAHSFQADPTSQTDRKCLPHKAVIETFSLVQEAVRRTLHLEPFDVQLIAAMAMARGCIAELPTGEGKTLAAVFAACLRALSGRGVHILTFNDYLARRDAAWMGPVYRLLGLTVGCVQEGMSPADKRAAYACDVTYAAAKEAGFDFLRDQIAFDRDALVHRPFSFALIDEADSILIDEARIPLVISGTDDRDLVDTNRLASIVKSLIPGKEFETDEEHRNVFLSEAGIERLESILECGSLYDSCNQTLLEAIYCALHAQALLRRDVDYIVRKDRIEIVDEYTGRVVEKRHWPDGLQAAVEAKESLSRKTQGRILGSITLQHFFRLYPVISGMTATAQSAADEFSEFYGMKVVVILPHTKSIRADHPDMVFTHREAKRRAIIQEIVDVHKLGRPILVGTGSIKESEEIATDLRTAGICCSVLNAKNDELEAGIIAKSGMLGAVTISTNMAGRGVDIKLGGNDESNRDAVVAMGGLYVIGTNRHESLRIDRQLRGRAGRQGDPGATRFFISFEDDLFEWYGLSKMFMAKYRLSRQESALPVGPIHREIAHAQRIIEGQNFDIRRSLNKYSSLVDLQRQIIQTRRDECLIGINSGVAAGSETMASICEPELLAEGLQRLGPAKFAELERRATLFHLDRAWSDHLAWIQDTRDSIHLVNLGGKEPIDEFRRLATDEFIKMLDRITTDILSEISTVIRKEDSVDLNLDRLKAPSSTWTYLVNDDQFGWGVELAKGKNIGFAKLAFSAPLYTGVLLILTLYLKHRSRRRNSSLR